MRLIAGCCTAGLCGFVIVSAASAGQRGHHVNPPPPKAHVAAPRVTPNAGPKAVTHGAPKAGPHSGPKTGPHSVPKAPHSGPKAVTNTASPAVPQTIAINPKLAARLQPLVPTGITVQDAAAGFKNQGQFIAALHVSQNLGIPFVQLKAAMTGPAPLSLGQAIQSLRPNAPVVVATETAEQQARVDVTVTGTTASSRRPKSDR